jgi:hypothetical protein
MRFRFVQQLFSAVSLASISMIASAQTCTPINVVPVTLGTPGKYCMTQSISTALTNGAAISVTAADVHIDLGGYILDGSAGGTSSTATAIFHNSLQRGFRLSNGTIRGFNAAVNAGIYATNPNPVLIEDVRIEASRGQALIVVGDHSIIRRVSIDGVVPRFGQTSASGVLGSGVRQRFIDLDISGVTEASGGVGHGITCSVCTGAILEGSRISGGDGAGTFRGAWLGATSSARRNSIHNADEGLRFSGTGSKYQDNLFTGVITSVVGVATDAGGNF